jgi:hypothetical protein
MLTVLFYYRSGFVESRRLPEWLTREDLRQECVKLGAIAWGGTIGE